MKNIIVTTLIGSAVVGAGMLYRVKQEFQDTTILSIQGVDMYGVEQKLQFSIQGCEYSNSLGDSMSGKSTPDDVELFCLLDDAGMTEEQFSCALSLCQDNQI